MELITIETEAYKSLMRRIEEIADFIMGRHKAHAQPAPALAQGEAELLTDREVQAILGISRRTLHGYRARGILAFRRIGRKIYHTRADIEAMLERHEVVAHGSRRKLR